MRLGAEHRAGLVDPLEDADHRLLVELRGLGQVGRAAEVVDAEHVGAGLGGRRHELRRLDLGEAEPVQGGPEAAQRRGGQLPARPAGRVPPGHGGVVQDRGQPGVDRGPPQLDRRGCAGSPSSVIPGSVTSTPPGAAGLRRGHAGDRDDALLAAAPHRPRASGSRTTTWARPERSRRMRNVTAPSSRRRCTQPWIRTGRPGAADGSSAASVRDMPASAAVMIITSSSAEPWRCGRGPGRGATAPSPA